MKNKKDKPKEWSETEEMELDHLYSSLHWSYADLARRFHCTVAEVRGKGIGE